MTCILLTDDQVVAVADSVNEVTNYLMQPGKSPGDLLHFTDSAGGHVVFPRDRFVAAFNEGVLND